ncbi:ATP-dependent protease La domain-containing protein [Cercophora newfieldiana]|uniref:ATP-dependent protease La domain-containing protein n=1 Tax=Cercophora newfieldiana TaxID=92897 RepID=A0AA39Y655_9PEZI|nr:ATP-dependent protease La domain-containing protein [Cercophora newfieldiana]
MSSYQESEEGIALATPASSTTGDHEHDNTHDDDAPFDASKLSPEQVRQVIQLIQCPVCSLPLRDPYTLPCGGTICKRCLPTPHQRVDISFFATSDRLQGIWCPVAGCAKEHAFGDCSPDVAVGRILDIVEARLEKEVEEALGSETTTHISTKDSWVEAGVPSLRTPETTSMVVDGGRVVAAYAMAKRGDLEYDAEVTFGSPAHGQAVCDARVLSTIKEGARTEADCQICYALFYDPVTTPCGHTFCRSCLQRVLDHARYCPVCRRPLSIQPVAYRESCSSNQFLTKMITYFWADLLDERRRAVVMERISDGNREYDIAVFICTLSFPSMPTFLHVFEPRYRLMIRRALEGDRTFGMVLGGVGGFSKVGTVLRIVNVEFFADGRSLLETVGTTRFRILDHGTLDGYVVAKIQSINDISMAEEEELEAVDIRAGRSRENSVSGDHDTIPRGISPSPMQRRIPTTPEEIARTSTKDLMDFGAAFVSRMREQSAPWLEARMFTIYGDCPNDPARFPWWLANILPVREAEKYRLLSTTSVRERLKLCCGWILEWQEATWYVRPFGKTIRSFSLGSFFFRFWFHGNKLSGRDPRCPR